MEIIKEDIIKLHDYLHINAKDKIILNIFNKHFESKQTKAIRYSYVHFVDKVIFRFFPDNLRHNFSIYQRGDFYGNSEYLNDDINDNIIKEMITYVKYKNRKDIIENICI